MPARNRRFSASSIFLAVFHSFVFRLPSFQQLDNELAHSYLQNWIGAERAFSDDTLRDSLCGFDLNPLEAMLVDVNRRLKRDKAFDEGRVQGRLVAALDGIEVLSSFSRRCDRCLERRVTLKDPAGRKIEQTQYYHRAVGCQMVHSPVKPFLAIEWLQPGEGEEVAALRLLQRLSDLYGNRFFDILLLDALLRADSAAAVAPPEGMGCGYQPEPQLPRFVSIGSAPVCGAGSGCRLHRAA
jgi:hypothetical protein